jgi:hypothetical protein
MVHTWIDPTPLNQIISDQMNTYIKRMLSLACAGLLLFSSCSDKTSNKEEETEISVMDSTSKAVKDSIDKLVDQTK